MSLLPDALRTELRATLRLAGPVVAAQLAHISMGFVDTVMVGRLGPEALAGVALGHMTFFFFGIMGMGTVRAVGPMVSQTVGAEDAMAVGRSVRQGLWLAGLAAAAVLLLLRFHWQVERAVDEETVPTTSDGVPSVDVSPVSATEEPTG